MPVQVYTLATRTRQTRSVCSGNYYYQLVHFTFIASLLTICLEPGWKDNEQKLDWFRFYRIGFGS